MARHISFRGIIVIAIALVAVGIGFGKWKAGKATALNVSPALPEYIPYAGEHFTFAFPQHLLKDNVDLQVKKESSTYFIYQYDTKDESPAHVEFSIEKFDVGSKAMQSVEHPSELWIPVSQVRISDNGKVGGFAFDPVLFPSQKTTDCALRYEFTWPRAKRIYRINFSVTQSVNPLLDQKVEDCHIYKQKEHDTYVAIMTELLQSMQTSE